MTSTTTRVTTTTRRYLQYLLILVAFHVHRQQHQQVVEAFTSQQAQSSSSSSISSTRNHNAPLRCPQHLVGGGSASLSLPSRTTAIAAASVISSNTPDESALGRRRRWHRRVWSRIVSRRSPTSSSSSGSGTDSTTAAATAPLQATAIALTYDEIEQETNILLDTIALYGPSSSAPHSSSSSSSNKQDNGRFILSGFEDKAPKEVLPLVVVEKEEEEDNDVTTSVVDSEFFDVSITTTTTTSPTTAAAVAASVAVAESSPATASSNDNGKGISYLPRLMAMLFENIVSSRIVRHSTKTPDGLEVQVVPTLNTVGRLFTRFQFMADVHISASDRLAFPNIRFSKGRLFAEQMTINLMGFLQSRRESSIKYPKQFDIHADGLTMTSNDLSNSSCIRNGLRRLLVRILTDRGIEPSSIQITSIDILPSGKIACKGEARTKFGSAPLPFEVRTGLAAESRGHVLTFPGLEVSLARDLGIFVPVLPTVDLDVGHNAVFRKIQIDGIKKEIILDATVTITPDRTLQLLKDYVQGSEAYAARFFYDVGRWLTELGNFTR